MKMDQLLLHVIVASLKPPLALAMEVQTGKLLRVAGVQINQSMTFLCS